MSILFNQEHAWILVLVLAALAFAAARGYRRVPPSVPPLLRRVLITLRILAICVVILVLLEPVVRLTGYRRERPVVAVLLDSSGSMGMADGTGGMRRGEEAVALLNEVVLPRVARDAEVRAYAFDGELRSIDTDRGELTAAPLFDGEVTDIPGALSALRREVPEGLAAIVLATDGANNRGGGVVEAWEPLGVPVYALGVGSEVAARDVAVREVLTNRISYVGEALPIEARLSSVGFAGATTTVDLSLDGQVIDTQTVDLSGTGGEEVVRFRVVPSAPGVTTYGISVPPARGEINEANNVRVVSTNTLGGKMRVLVAAPRPGWDFAFTRRELETDGNIELITCVLIEGAGTERRGETPGAAEDVLGYDVIVLVEPDMSSSVVPGEWVERYVRERGGGLLLLGEPAVSGRGEGGVASVSPIFTSRRSPANAVEARVRLSAAGETSPLMRLVDGRLENESLWRSLPPVWVGGASVVEARPEATVLAEADLGGGETTAVIASSRVGAGNVVAIAASGLWRWKMAAPDETDVFDVLLANATRWLTARGDLARVVVETDEGVYSSGQKIGLSAQVYGSDYRVSRNATVTVEVSTGEQAAPVESVTLAPDGEFFRAEIGPLAPGRYIYRAEGTIGGESMGEDSGEFIVEEFSLEDAEVRRRPGVLHRLADESGGIYMAPESIDGLSESVPLERRTVALRRELELWNSPWPLLALVGLLSVEWALRRSKGMP